MATAVVDLSILEANLIAVRSLVNEGTQVMPAIKADAYGHGAVRVAGALAAKGVNWFAVATPHELLQLRRAGITANLLLLTPVLERPLDLVHADAVFTLADFATLARLSHWRVPAGTRVHLKVDTGLGRLGVSPEEAADLAIAAERAGLNVEGLFTHFAAAETDPRLTGLQIERFEDTVANLARHGIHPPLKHLSNSAGIMTHAEAGGNIVRPGILLYGYSPVEGPHELKSRLRPALSLLAPVIQVKRLAAGQGVGYNHRWTTDRPTTILTVRCGYADGYRRLLSNQAWASLHGQRIPVRGQVAMDQLMLDAGDLEADPGEIVTLLGGLGPLADELGALSETNAYDILTSLTARVGRQYVRDAH